MPPLMVLADANILVKDVVSNAFYDLANTKIIDLRWIPQIEAEYAKHRARLRAETNGRAVEISDLVWAERRLKPIKKYLIPNFLPPAWDKDGDRLAELEGDAAFAPLLKLKDPNDVHVALAAADWARSTGQDVLLATENLKDLPPKLMEPFHVTPLHPGDVLQLAYWADPDGVSQSLRKTAADFNDPAFSLTDMLRSVVSPQQFAKPELAAELAQQWGVATPGQRKTGKPKAKPFSGEQKR